MKERRTLVEGLKDTPPPIEPAIERDFVLGKDKTPVQPEPVTLPAPTLQRSPISTRIRSDFATALKRASLERQLEGKMPNTISDILEAALEPWLRSNGYFS